MQCTSCGCEWDSEDGFYHNADGSTRQPCKICQCDTNSLYYVNNAEMIREQKRESYYAALEEKRAYYRQYRARQRAQATV